MPRALGLAIAALILGSGCSMQRFAVNRIGDMLSDGGSVYESENDPELVGEALPFSLKLVDSLLLESPEHRGLLLNAASGYTLYAYAYIHFPAEQVTYEDLARARELRERARNLYLRAFAYAVRAIELDYPDFSRTLLTAPESATARLGRRPAREVEALYWAAASLGLAISVSKGEAALLARLGEVEAMLARALTLDETYDDGALHEFAINLATGVRTGKSRDAIEKHYQAALTLSRGSRAGLFVTYAEAVAVPDQDREQFEALLDKALAVDVDAYPERRLLNLLAQQRAQWLLGRIDELFL
jgi:predicted anti-sigma-YlaC factor YlaD